MTQVTASHNNLQPSPWVTRWLQLASPDSGVLDLACGHGRHTRLAAQNGHRVVALDRSADALACLDGVPGVRTVQADIENGAWPLKGEQFDVVIVTNYLYRPILPDLLQSVCASGLLIYETFAMGNERYGRPSNPAFLLGHGELYDLACPSMRVLAYEDVYVKSPKPALVQRICAGGPGFIWPLANN